MSDEAVGSWRPRKADKFNSEEESLSSCRGLSFIQPPVLILEPTSSVNVHFKLWSLINLHTKKNRCLNECVIDVGGFNSPEGSHWEIIIILFYLLALVSFRKASWWYVTSSSCAGHHTVMYPTPRKPSLAFWLRSTTGRGSVERVAPSFTACESCPSPLHE